MKKCRLILLGLMLFAALLTLGGCHSDTEDADPHNVSVKQVYGYAEPFTDLIRYDFNEFGKPLGATLLNWHTLTEEKSLSTYRYDKAGKLVGHSVLGTELTVEFGEDGLPVRASAFCDTHPYVVYYTCGENGAILVERILHHGSEQYLLEYNDLGYPTKINGIEFSVSETGSRFADDDVVYCLRLNEEGRPADIIREGDTWSLCRWNYDDKGNVTAFDGREPTRFFRYLLKADMTYDGEGRLLTYKADYGDADKTDFHITYHYDNKGGLSETVKVTDGAKRVTRYQKGVPVSEVREEYEEKDGVSRLISLEETKLSTEEDPVKTIRSYYVKEDGSRAIAHYADYTCDKYGNTLTVQYARYREGGGLSEKGEGANTYRPDGTYQTYGKSCYYQEDGSLKREEEATQEYDRDGVVIRAIERMNPDNYYYTDTTKTSEYTDGRLTKRTTEALYSGAEDSYFPGKRVRRILVEDYKDGEVQHSYLENYLNGELEAKEEMTYRPHPDGGGRKYSEAHRENYETAEDGTRVRRVVDQIRGLQDTEDYTVTVYHNDVLKSVSYERLVHKQKVTDEVITTSRAEYSLDKIFDAEGELFVVTECYYEYHENDRLALVRGTICDAEGNVLQTILERYDKNGVKQ